MERPDGGTGSEDWFWGPAHVPLGRAEGRFPGAALQGPRPVRVNAPEAFLERFRPIRRLPDLFFFREPRAIEANRRRAANCLADGFFIFR
jgi:hypothetical protein